MDSAKWLAAAICLSGVTLLTSGSASAQSQPFNRRADTQCTSNKTECTAQIDLPSADRVVINFVSCSLGYDGEIEVRLNVVRSGEESGFFNLLPPTGGPLLKYISQTTSIYVPKNGAAYLIFTAFGGQLRGRPSCVVSGYSD